ncbi:MAG: Type 1 glutamine amidotransferase-like domain-containing protein [Firmicutes bacterium]|nr:Type 1 glutamine amidotransferase-like domain-containing protein [Bacillota bacterium]
MRQRWRPESNCLIICAYPDSYEGNDEMGETFYKAFNFHGLSIRRMVLCDSRNESELPHLLAESDFVILAGGHVPTENAFFQRIGLRELLQKFDGIVMGISAGTMNCAEVVYAQPEEPGESVDPEYQRFIPGLGLTDIMVLPHYQMVKGNILDGKRLYEDITFKDSMGHEFVVLVDGSYIMIEDDLRELHGEAYLIEDGSMRLICRENEMIII